MACSYPRHQTMSLHVLSCQRVLGFARGNTQDFGIQIPYPLDMSYKSSSFWDSFFLYKIVSETLKLPLIFISLRHILCEKQGKVNEAYQKLQDGWLSNGDKVPPAEFAKVNLPPIAFSLKTLVSESLLNLDRN